jgi:hypothetical protein
VAATDFTWTLDGEDLTLRRTNGHSLTTYRRSLT